MCKQRRVYGKGWKASSADSVENAFIDRKALSSSVHGELLSLYRYYLVAGGMPATVAIIPVEVKADEHVRSRSLSVHREQFGPELSIRLPTGISVLRAILHNSALCHLAAE